MKWEEKVLIYKIFLQVWARINEVYAPGTAKRDAPQVGPLQWIPMKPYVDTRYKLVKSQKKLVEQDC